MGKIDRQQPVAVDENVRRDFAAMGVRLAPDETAKADDSFGIWPDNAAAVHLFIACETQWNVAIGHSRMIWLGLNYPAVDIIMTAHEIKDRKKVFGDIQVMERAALEAFWEENE